MKTSQTYLDLRHKLLKAARLAQLTAKYQKEVNLNFEADAAVYVKSMKLLQLHRSRLQKALEDIK